MRCDRKDARIPSIRNCSRACTHPPLRLDFLCQPVWPCLPPQLNAFEKIIIENSLYGWILRDSPPPYFFFFFPNNDRDRVYFRERRRGGYVSICRKGERGGECKANELGLDDRARCTRSVRSGRSFMHSGFFADNKIAASVSAVARCVGCIFSATLAIKWTTQYAFIWRVRGDG